MLYKLSLFVLVRIFGVFFINLTTRTLFLAPFYSVDVVGLLENGSFRVYGRVENVGPALMRGRNVVDVGDVLDS